MQKVGCNTPASREEHVVARIIEYAARRHWLVLALAGAAAVVGWSSMRQLPLDALPDLGDTQVIVYSTWDRSADLVERQVTYPIVTSLLGTPRVKSVRGLSDYGASFVYVIFDEGTDLYWARARTLEYLSPILKRLPAGVETELGPDATSLGWVFQYALVDESGTHTLAELRSFQDWTLRYYLKSVRGVADVASVGGHVRQYQIDVDPDRLREYRLPISRVVDAVRAANNDAGGRVIEFGATEYTVRGLGFARSPADFENTVVAESPDGTAVRLRDVGRVTLGPDQRRGVTDLDGRGEVVSGIVLMRAGENARAVVDRVKEKLASVRGALPAGVRVEPIYDRSILVTRSVENLTWTLGEIMVTVALVIVLFLWHLPSALIPIVTIPVAVLIAFIPFHALGVTLNIMSLSGIALAVGALVDASIVLVEQTHKRLELWRAEGGAGDHRPVLLAAMRDVAAPSFFALLIIAVAFLPILTLEAEAGRLFRPLAYAKSLCMAIGAVLAITLVPALRMRLPVGRIRPEQLNPLSRALRAAYGPIAAWSLERPWLVVGIAATMLVVTIPVATRLGSEFMPPLDEGTLLYMPSTLPGLPVSTAAQLLQATDRVIKQFPEVDRVLGKAGRADTATDPAPVSMFETLITLKPTSEWRTKSTWYSSWAPAFVKPILRRITPDHISHEALVEQLDRALTIPGLSNSWTMPVKARTTMQTTGIRTAVGIKISGDDIPTLDRIAAQIERLLPRVTGTRSVFGEHAASGYFLDIAWNRAELAQYGLTIDEAQALVRHAIGGENVATTVEGRERYPVSVRYRGDSRSELGALSRLPVPVSGGERHVPLAQLATINATTGASMIRNDEGLRTGYVYVDVADRDLVGYVAEARALLDAELVLPPGYMVSWSGQYEALKRAEQRLWLIVPLTLAAVIGLLYANTRSFTRTGLILLAVPFSAIGAVWLLYVLDYNMSIGVWVGLVALLGVDAETGVFMLMYLDLAYEEAKRKGRLTSGAELRQAVLQGAVMRVRPKIMTAATMVIGLLPMMWATGEGADVMKRIAAPLVGGITTSVLLELFVYPSLFLLWKRRSLFADR
jgi:Cu(I)/Ag(I) efflux system membrane protein CusA/SilA